MRQFAISDIHGCHKTFKHVVTRRIQLRQTDTLYLLGDYIDRGPDSKAVIDFILQLQAAGFQVICLTGNHEDHLIRARDEEKILTHWKKYGGITTLNSFGIQHPSELAPRYLNFFKELYTHRITPSHILVHAGLNFQTSNSVFEDYNALIWRRNWYEEIDYERIKHKTIVHGHTPVSRAQIKKQLAIPNHPVNIDGGCVYSSVPNEDLGYLCAYNLIEHTVLFQKNIDLPLWIGD